MPQILTHDPIKKLHHLPLIPGAEQKTVYKTIVTAMSVNNKVCHLICIKQIKVLYRNNRVIL